MKCPACDSDIPVDARFCAYCGTPVVVCVPCEIAYPSDVTFCGACGSNVGRQRNFHTIDLRRDLPPEKQLDEDEEWLLRDRPGVFGFLFHPEYPDRRHFIHDGDNTIGAGDKNDVVIDLPAVSWNHALLIGRNKKLMVQDSASTNGTFVNDLRVQRPTELRHGDILRLGNVAYQVWIKPQLRS